MLGEKNCSMSMQVPSEESLQGKGYASMEWKILAGLCI